MKHARTILGDRGVSDLLGTTILLGVTISLVAVAGMQLLKSAGTAPEVPTIDVRVSARPGDNYLQVVHLGGAEVNASNLRAIVTVNGSAWYTGDLSASTALWRLGGNHTIQPLAGSLPYGARVEVTLASKTPSGVAALSVVNLPLTEPGSAVAPTGFTVTVRFDGNLSTGNVTPPNSFFIYATVAHPDGRKAVRSVTANLTVFNGSVTTKLFDDGTTGDLLAGDGVYSNSVWVAAGTLGPSRSIEVTATDGQGYRASGSGTVFVHDPSGVQSFARTVFNTTGNRMLKFDGGPSGDRVTPHLKFQLTSYPLILEDNSSWTIDKVWMYYIPLKQSSDSAIVQEIVQACGSGTTFVYHKPPNGNLTISNYYMDRDDFRYYFKLQFKSGSNNFFVTNINGAQDYDFFIMRGSEPHKIVQDSIYSWPPWPQTFSDCTP